MCDIGAVQAFVQVEPLDVLPPPSDVVRVGLAPPPQVGASGRADRPAPVAATAAR